MNKRYWFSAVLALTAAVAVSAAEAGPDKPFYTLGVSAMPEPALPLPAGATVSFDASQSADGDGSVRIDYETAGPGSMILFAAANPGLDNCAVWYEASLRGAGLKNIAYLEMWCDFGDNQYFSRGLDQVILGEADWRQVRIPFFLKAGERPARFLLGVRMEGPGTVWLDGIALSRAALPDPSIAGGAGTGGGAYVGGVVGAALGLFGGLCGVWGALSGILAPRGKARGFVLASGWVLTAFGVALLAAGVVLSGTGSPLGRPCLLAGIVISAVMLLLNFVVRRAYEQAEMRRLAAQDLR